MVRKTCTVGNCGKYVHGRGFCKTHYARWEKGGSPHFIKAVKTGPERHSWKRVRKACETCGDYYWATRTRASATKYCGSRCYWKSLIGKTAHNKAKNPPNLCERCGKSFRLAPAQSAVARFCCRKCKGEWQSETIRGELHPNWEGGKSYEPYPAGFHRLLKRKIKTRDGYVCQGCGVTEVEYRVTHNSYLGVHHIDCVKHNLDHSNLITACLGCNSRANGLRTFWPVRYSFRFRLAEWVRSTL